MSTKRDPSRKIVLAAAGAASMLLGRASVSGAAVTIDQDDIVIGTSQAGTNSVTLVHNGVPSNPWNTSFIEPVRFDNLNGIQHNGAGNLLGVNFGTALSGGPPPSAGGGTIYTMATNGTSNATQIFSWDDPAFSNLSMYRSRLGGLSVSPDNTQIAVTGYDTSALYVFNYSAGNENGLTGSLSNGRISPAGVLLGPTNSSFVTAGTLWYTNSSVLSLDGQGNLHDFVVSPSTVSDSTISTSHLALGSYTSLASTPLSPYVFAMTSSFAAGTSTNTLYVLDLRNGFNIVNTVNYSPGAAASVLDNTSRDIAFDSKGDLLISEYSNGATNTGTNVFEIPNAAANATTLGNDAMLLGTFGAKSSYPSMDVALAPSPVQGSGRDLNWAGGASGTWDGAASNWSDGSQNVVWSDSNPDNAVFGTGGGTGATAAVTVAGSRTAGSITFAAGAPVYTLSGGSIQINGDNSGIGIAAENSATLNSDVNLNGAQLVSVGNSQTLTIGGAVSGGALNKFGTGTLVLTNSANSQAGLVITQGQVQVGSDAPLGSGVVQFSGGTLTTTADVAFPASRSFNNVNSGTLNTGAFNVTINSPVQGSAGAILTKAGSGTLTLAQPSPNYFGGWIVSGGTLLVNASNPDNVTGLGVSSGTQPFNNGVQVLNGGTLHLGNVTVGTLGGPPASGPGSFAPSIFLDNGGTLLATGKTTYTGGALNVVRGPGDAKSVTIATGSAGDVLTLQDTVRQWDVGSPPYDVGPANSVVHVQGPGRVVLQSGGTTSAATFAGSWQVDSGILQIGPVVPNASPAPGSTNNGPFGEPLNALGFKSPDGGSGDPDQPNAITVAGGILAVAVDAPNTNPNVTNPPVNPTPTYLRSPVTLAGGAIAATGQEVSYDPATDGPQGIPTGVPVSAQFGGDFTVAAGTSRVLVYDPVDGGARSVSLVGGTRTLHADSPFFSAGTTLTYATNWVGTLVVDPGTTTRGAFNVIRDGGTVSVTPGATIHNLAGATLYVAGQIDPFTDTTTPANHVAIVNDGSLNVNAGSKSIAGLSGSGSLSIAGGATLQLARGTLSTLNAQSALDVDTASGSALDLTTNTLQIHYAAGSSPLSTIASYVKSGFNGGAWDGPGINTSAADAHHALGYSDSAHNALLPANTVEVRYTIVGDVNLDGSVGFPDLLTLAQHYGQSNATWDKGDVTYDGSVGFNDLLALAQNYGGVLTAAQMADFNPAFAGDAQRAFAAVPEPSSGLVVGCLALAAFRRRRRA